MNSVSYEQINKTLIFISSRSFNEDLFINFISELFKMRFGFLNYSLMGRTTLFSIWIPTCIMHQHADIGNIIGMITGDLKVIDIDGAFQDLVLDFFDDDIFTVDKY